MRTCRDTHARAVEVHERAARLHDEAAERARAVGDVELEAVEREFADKERRAAKHARERDATTVAMLVSLGL
jgi:hypothetical protein